MRKIPFLILLAFCFTSLLGGIFCCEPIKDTYAEHESQICSASSSDVQGTANAGVEVELSSANELYSYVSRYAASNANDIIELCDEPNEENTLFDMREQTLSITIGNEASPFCGTFDGKGHTITNLTIDLTSQSSKTTTYAGLFGKLGHGAKICNVNFENLTIKTADATTVYAGVIAYGENCEVSNVRILDNFASNGANLEIGEAGSCFVGGLLGFVKDSKITGLQIANNINFKLSKNEISYVGALVGKADATAINNVQISPISSDKTLAVTLEGSEQAGGLAFASNLNFGGMAGELENSFVTNIICRTNNFGKWDFSRNDRKIHNLGGVAGSISSSTLNFGIVKTNINLVLEPSFEGNVNVGGLAGKISQSSSKITNFGMKNTISAKNNSALGTLFVGELIGKVANPVPLTQNISHVHYARNNGVEIFGDQGQYAFKDPRNLDFISFTTSQFDLDNLQMIDGKCPYFSQQVWNTSFNGDWDFENTWYIASQSIYLQNFYDGYTVSITNVDDRALVFDGINDGRSTSLSNLTYGQQVRLKYSFKVVNGLNMNDFFELSTLRFNGVDEGRFLKSGEGYRLSENENYSVEMIEDNGKIIGFEVVINNLSRATMGTYSVTIATKKFSATISTWLYEGDEDSGTWNEELHPGRLQVDNGTPSDGILLLNDRLTYGSSFKISTSAKTPKDGEEIYAPTNEWFLVTETENGRDIKQISDDYINNGVLFLNFGEGDFVGNLTIFAKYTKNSCTGIFTFDEGVQKIELGSGNVVIESSEDNKRPISKEDPKLSLDIYILKGYDFDQTRFIDELGYKSKIEGKDFCTFLSQEEMENSICYRFQLDMTSLNWDDVNNITDNTLQIRVKTTSKEKKDNSWIWWLVGGIAGAILLVGIVILIVWLVRRNRFGGGGGGKMKYTKKNYKQMYY